MPEIWFVPSSATIPSSRIDGTLGMRSALSASHNRVIPGIAGLGFVRQASWACAAIALVGEGRKTKLNNAQVANALEALACKHVFRAGTRLPLENVRGSTRLAVNYSDPVQWSCSHLRLPKNYVTQPFRQSTTEALTPDGGLGFVQPGTSRFNGMELSERGGELAEAFLSQKVSYAKLRKVLRKWLDAGRSNDSGKVILEAGEAMLASIRPGQASPSERSTLRRSLSLELGREQAALCGGDARRRTRLHVWLTSLGREQAEKIRVEDLETLLRTDGSAQAIAHWHAIQENFYLARYLNSARVVLISIIELHKDGRNATCLDTVAQNGQVASACARYCAAGSEYRGFLTDHPDLCVNNLALDPDESDYRSIIEGITAQVPLLMRIERNMLVAGTLMRTPPNIQIESDLTDMLPLNRTSWVPRRFRQFRNLVLECGND